MVSLLSLFFLLGSCNSPKQVSSSVIKDTLYIEKWDTVKLVSNDTVFKTIDRYIYESDSTVIREFVDELGVKNREIERYKSRLNDALSQLVESHNKTANETSSSVVDHVSASEVESVVVEPEHKPSFFKSLFQKIGNAVFFIIYTFVIVVVVVFIHKIIIINKNKDLWKY